MTAATAAPNQPFKVGGNPSNHTCALHKLRWGSDPTMDAAGEKPEASPSQKTGLVRSATRAGLGGHHSQSPQKKGGVCPRDLDAALTKAVADGDRLQFDRPLPNDYGLARPERQMSKSASETSDAGGWGFYKDCEGTPGDSAYRLDATALANRETPDYVLEDSLDSQALWHATAGARPAQPAHERRKFEEMWSKQLASSEATRCVPTEKCADLSAPRPGDGAKVLLRDASPFGTSVTKSWRCECCGELTSIMVRIPKYQVVRPAGGGRPHAEFLVVARLGAVTFGLWRRYSHFEKLNEKIATSFRKEDYQNTHWSWRCLRRRQRWFRCLDREYLALKCFLLERFLHDLVFEAAASSVFTEFFELEGV